jgi:rod shape-determining protein MreC
VVQMREENVRLKLENAQLVQWQSSAKQLEAENKALRKLLNVPLPAQSTYVSARIVGDAGGPYVHAALLAVGRAEGVAENQAVMTEAGLLGRIIEAGDHSARVLLLTDINSRVPVIGEESRERGILAGDNSGALSLHYLLADTKIRSGERLVTSGDGGVFPPGIPVGMVQSVEGHKISVTPLVDRSNLEYVRVIDFRL